MTKLSGHLYIYYISRDSKNVIYERSMPRQCVREADDRVRALRSRGLEAFYTIGDTFPGTFY